MSSKVTSNVSHVKEAWPENNIKEVENEDEDEIRLINIDGLTGFKFLINKEGSFIRRFGWLFIITTCLILVFTLIFDRMSMYISTPLYVRRKGVRNFTLSFPDIYLCPYRHLETGYRSYHLNYSVLETLWKLHFPDKKPPRLKYSEDLDPDLFTSRQSTVNFDKVMDILRKKIGPEELQNQAKTHIDDRIIDCKISQVLDCTPEYLLREEVQTLNGLCNRYHVKHPSVSGPYQGIKMMLDSADISRHQVFRFAMLLQSSTESPDIEIYIHGMQGFDRWHKNIILTLSQFTLLNLRWKPCETDENNIVTRCHSRCLENAFAKEFNCKLLFMKTVNKWPLCSSLNYSHLEEEFLAWLSGYKILNCSCGQTCISRHYGKKLDSVEVESGYASFHVYYIEPFYDDYEENFSYDIYTLLSDFGGIIGLLIGMSALSILKNIEYCYFHCKKKKKIEASQKSYDEANDIFRILESSI